MLLLLSFSFSPCLFFGINNYFKSKEWYADRGLPYRFGILLHGPPGTGKSSLPVALATFFSLPIYAIPPLDEQNSQCVMLEIAFKYLPHDCFVVIKDVDGKLWYIIDKPLHRDSP